MRAYRRKSLAIRLGKPGLPSHNTNLEKLFPEWASSKTWQQSFGFRNQKFLEISQRLFQAQFSPLLPRAQLLRYSDVFMRERPQEPEILEDEIELPHNVRTAHPNAYFLQVEGDCMDKVYPEGCYILVDPDREPCNGSIAAVVIDGRDAVMRRLLRTSSTIVLAPESTNPEHKDLVITANDEHTVELVGTVVWFQASREME